MTAAPEAEAAGPDTGLDIALDAEPRPTLRQLGGDCLLLGATAFGGGAMISLLQDRFTQRRRWLRDREFLEAATLAQSLPGAIATNTVAFVGYRLHGPVGALVSMALYALPSFVLMLVFAALYGHLRDIPSATAVLTGLNAAASGLVAVTAVRLGRQAVAMRWQGLQAAAVFGLAISFPALTLYLILLSLLGGLLWAAWQRRMPPVPEATTPETIVHAGASLPLRHHLLLATGLGLLVTGLWLGSGFITEPFLRRLVQLALVTLKVGGLTFGGGFVIIPLLGHEVVDVHLWLTPKEVSDAAALGLLTPGPFVIAAAFIGYRVAGLAGAAVTTLGIFGLPLWLVVMVAGAVERFRQNALVQGALRGVMPTGVALLAAAAVTIGKGAYTPDLYTWVLAPGLGLTSAWLAGRHHTNPMFILFGGALVGLAGQWLFA
ncbi:chromate efflux transporter [Chloracidobacterium thermophilum]|uniref:Chromate transporter, chromate ion transporter (CHR) family n=1 Tax=Chloracidobacterium thermophilum (strain B) TaxID=981222 RepID=G2LIX2_CHLTF|nr:chromate efflux transporter [Chloracidobacterium thermophilum]AEP12740.1 chromate transporter, chromate ion transporter (CHR) family [Chloracidobacterium thermophilum B]QUV78473.1 chromate efflux transporter [Chloracidobacterium thermophilum]